MSTLQPGPDEFCLRYFSASCTTDNDGNAARAHFHGIDHATTNTSVQNRKSKKKKKKKNETMMNVNFPRDSNTTPSGIDPSMMSEYRRGLKKMREYGMEWLESQQKVLENCFRTDRQLVWENFLETDFQLLSTFVNVDDPMTMSPSESEEYRQVLKEKKEFDMEILDQLKNNWESTVETNREWLSTFVNVDDHMTMSPSELEEYRQVLKEKKESEMKRLDQLKNNWESNEETHRQWLSINNVDEWLSALHAFVNNADDSSATADETDDGTDDDTSATADDADDGTDRLVRPCNKESDNNNNNDGTDRLVRPCNKESDNNNNNNNDGAFD